MSIFTQVSFSKIFVSVLLSLNCICNNLLFCPLTNSLLEMANVCFVCVCVEGINCLNFVVIYLSFS